jgi:hypothetical protein
MVGKPAVGEPASRAASGSSVRGVLQAQASPIEVAPVAVPADGAADPPAVPDDE